MPYFVLSALKAVNSLLVAAWCSPCYNPVISIRCNLSLVGPEIETNFKGTEIGGTINPILPSLDQ